MALILFVFSAASIRHALDLLPTQDSSHKSRFRVGFPILKMYTHILCTVECIMIHFRQMFVLGYDASSIRHIPFVGDTVTLLMVQKSQTTTVWMYKTL